MGFGDLHARTTNEMVFCMVCMLLGVAWHAFVVSTVTQLMHTVDSHAERLSHMHRTLHAFFGYVVCALHALHTHVHAHSSHS